MPYIRDQFQRSLFEQELEYWELPAQYNHVKRLIAIFDSQPENMPDSCLVTWNKLGPFDLENLIQTNFIIINEKLKFSQAQ